jgi:hypothetical protein
VREGRVVAAVGAAGYDSQTHPLDVDSELSRSATYQGVHRISYRVTAGHIVSRWRRVTDTI